MEGVADQEALLGKGDSKLLTPAKALTMGLLTLVLMIFLVQNSSPKERKGQGGSRKGGLDLAHKSLLNPVLQHPLSVTTLFPPSFLSSVSPTFLAALHVLVDGRRVDNIGKKNLAFRPVSQQCTTQPVKCQ